jgi:tetratricopeptide (TPR) repeat protein
VRARATVVASALAVSTTAYAAAAPARDPIDEREIAAMRAGRPHVEALLDEGEALADAGRMAEAESLFRQSHAEYPYASFLWRRDCEALTALGRRDEAILACSSAVGAFRSGVNVRALVSALVDGPAPPTITELSLALTIVANEHKKGPSLTVAAAACDIAQRIGDDVMLRECAQALERTAPDDPATWRARSVLDARCPPWRFWAGWGGMIGLVTVTIGHALGRKARRFRSRQARLAVVAPLSLVSIALASWPGGARAEEPARSTSWLSTRPVDDQHPDSNIPTEKERNADPLQFGYWLQDVALKGEHASKRGDHAAAARFYDTLAKAVPDRAVGFVKACEEYESLGDREKAIDRCGDALLRDGLQVKDYTHFVHLVVGKRGPLSAAETASLASVIAHMKDDPSGRPFADDLECEVGARTDNLAQLEECTTALAARAPDDPKTISYLWAKAAAEGNTGDADRLIQRASAAGVGPEDIQRMKSVTGRRAMWRAVRTSAFAVALALFVGGIVLAIRALLSRRSNAKGAPREWGAPSGHPEKTPGSP